MIIIRNAGKQVLIVVVLLSFIISSCAVYAATDISVSKKGTYVYWFSYTDGVGDSRVTLPQSFKGKSAKLDTEKLGETSKDIELFIMNKRTGNMAIVDYTPPKDKAKPAPIKLGEDDFEYVRNAKLKIISEDGAPLESAVVNITDGLGQPMKALVTPVDEGVASFENVATGEISVKVEANGLKRTIDSDIELPAKRDASSFEMDIKVAGDVDTLPKSTAKEIPTKEKAKKASEAGSGSSVILQFVAGLIFLAVVIAVVYAIVKSKGISAESALKKMGVELPSDQAAQPTQPSAPTIDPSVCEFCGQKKDVSGSCACTVSPAASPFGAPAQSAGSGPRIIGIQGAYTGQIFPISGTAVIGREPERDIALVNDTTVSRRHASITAANGGFTIKDEGSANGTFVNGAKITEQKLTPGDEIQLGGSRFRFDA